MNTHSYCHKLVDMYLSLACSNISGGALAHVEWLMSLECITFRKELSE